MANANIYTGPNLSSAPFAVSFNPIAFTNTSVTLSVGCARATTNDWVVQWPGTIANLPGEIVVPTNVVASFGQSGVSPALITAPSNGLLILPMYICDNTSQTTDGSTNAQVQPAVVIATGANFVPNGYDVYKQIGFVLVNSAGNLVPYSMTGIYNERYVTLQDAELFLNVTSSAPTTQTTADLILGASGPTIASNLGISQINIQWYYTPNAATSILSLVPTGLTPQSSTFPIQIKTNGTAQEIGNVVMNPGIDVSTPSAPVLAIDYKTSSASDVFSLYIAGFTYSIPYAS